MSMVDLSGTCVSYNEIFTNHGWHAARKTALVCGGERRSWAEVDRRTAQVAQWLHSLGVRKGDRVVLLMESAIPMFEMLWGVIRAGCVVVPLNPLVSRETLSRMVDNCEASVVVADAATFALFDQAAGCMQKLAAQARMFCLGGAPGWVDPAPDIEGAPAQPPQVESTPADTLNIIYSSGSTGMPKGVEHTGFGRLHMFLLNIGPAAHIERSTVCLCSTPLHSNGTWITMFATVYWGGTIVLLPKFSPEGFLETVVRERITHAFMVPAQYAMVVQSEAFGRHDTSSLRSLIHAGQAMNSRTYEELREKLPHAGLYEIYGLTEGLVTLSIPGDRELPGKELTVGAVAPGVHVVILGEDGEPLPAGQVGEIAAHSTGLHKGYYRDPVRTAEASWTGPDGKTYLRTGDMGKLDEDGYLYLSGRLKDMIKSGGINVFASDIEEVFMKHPEVQELAAIGVPSEKWGETPLLLAIMKPGSAVPEEELMKWGNERLGKYQRVSRVEYRTEFPRVSLAKVNKPELRKPYWEGR